MSNSIQAGDSRIDRIVEFEGAFRPAFDMLKGLTPERLEENRHWLEPDALVEGDVLRLAVQTFVVRTPHHTVLIDTCIGNDKDNPRFPAWHAKTDTRFMDGLGGARAWRRSDRLRHVHAPARRPCRLEHAEAGRALGADLPERPLRFRADRIRPLAARERQVGQPSVQRERPADRRGGSGGTGRGATMASATISACCRPRAIRRATSRLRSGRRPTTPWSPATSCTRRCRPVTRRCRSAFDVDPALSATSRRAFLERFAETPTICCMTHFPSPSIGRIKRWGEGFRCENLGS